MKVEFNDYIYNIGYRTGRTACTGCIISKDKTHLKCTLMHKDNVFYLSLKFIPIMAFIKYLNYENKFEWTIV